MSTRNRESRQGWYLLLLSLVLAIVLGVALISAGGFVLGSLARNLEATDVSPNGQWELRVYVFDYGAVANTRQQVIVRDRRSGEESELYLGGRTQAPPTWVDEDTVLVDGHRYDMTSLDRQR